jgi:F-type H+-transporting ATPase subunit b
MIESMKINLKKILLAAIAIAALPGFAFAAEEAAPEGSWFGTLIYGINFALFVGIIVVYAGPAIRGFFRDRASGIRSQLDHLNSALQEAQDLANRAAARAAKLEEEIAQIKTEMENETVFLVNRIHEGARTTAERIRRDTELTSAANVDAAQRRVRARLAANAANIARELIARSFEASDQSRLVDNFMDKIRHEAVQ